MSPAADQNLCGYLVSETPTKRRPWASNARDAEAAAERPFFFLHFLAATALRPFFFFLHFLDAGAVLSGCCGCPPPPPSGS